MKTISRIARLELSTLFYSPIAWFLLIIFLFQCSLQYTGAMGEFVSASKQFGSGALNFLTAQIYSSPFDSLFATITGKIYLYIPLLTMGLMSRELSSGTIKLLYSSPITIKEIIFGKYLAMMIYNLLLIGIVCLFVLAGIIYIAHIDLGLIFSGLLAIYLLLCAYSAIGLFMSCLTSYQVVAAISTLVVFAVLDYVGGLWQGIDFVRDLTSFLSIAGRTQGMIGGLISTSDLVYFLVIIYIFLGLSIFKLQAGRESKSIWVKTARYTFVLVSALAVGYIFSRPALTGYLDTTRTKANTLTVNTQKTISEISDEPLEVTAYINLLDRFYGYFGKPEARNQYLSNWAQYVRFKPNTKFKYVYYYDSTFSKNLYRRYPGVPLDSIANAYAENMDANIKLFKTPAEIRKIINLRPEENRFVMQLKYKNKTTFLRVFDDQSIWPSETETSAAIKRLITKLPKILFLTGDLERSINKIGEREYKVLTNSVPSRSSLINQGFDVDTISSAQEIPTDIAALVIADPKTNLSVEGINRIKRYIDAGGNLLLTAEPGKQTVLSALIKPLGVQIMEGTLVEQGKGLSPDIATPYLTGAALTFSKNLERVIQDSIQISMPGAAGLTYATGGAFKIEPVLMTDGKTNWNKKGKLVVDSADVVYAPQEGDEKKPIATALRLTRMVNGKEQRIIITGDADFFSNAELSRNNLRTANFQFSTALFGWFSYGQFPIDTSRPPSIDNHFYFTKLTWLKIILMGVLPGLLLIGGGIFLIRRKRK